MAKGFQMMITMSLYRWYERNTWKSCALSDTYDVIGVSISKREKCTLSQTGCAADFCMWSLRRIKVPGLAVLEEISSCEIPHGKRFLKSAHLALQAHSSP
jgi:hypothetical protein